MAKASSKKTPRKKPPAKKHGLEVKHRRMAYLVGIRDDLRNEIKQRILQRDRYANQLTLAMGAIMAVAMVPGLGAPGNTPLARPYLGLLVVVPLVGIFYSSLILYSYKIHRTLARHIEQRIEPEIEELCPTPLKPRYSTPAAWEMSYVQTYSQTPGIRSGFLRVMTEIAALLAMTVAWVAGDLPFVLLLILTIAYWMAFGYLRHSDDVSRPASNLWRTLAGNFRLLLFWPLTDILQWSRNLTNSASPGADDIQ